MRSIILIVVLAIAPAVARAEDKADPAAGAKTFAACSICHRVGEGAENVVGPQLNGIVGRKAGSVQNFAYSEAMKASGIIWTDDLLLTFIAAPRKTVPGTRMTYGGMKDEAAARNLVAYLAGFRTDGTRSAP